MIAQQRINYIQSVQKYRSQDRLIYYQDETWMNQNMTPTKAWLDPNREGPPALPQGKGQRTIVCHIGCEHGFLEQASLIYRGNKALKDSDYHSEMNSDVFENWIEEKVFRTVPPGSVIVLDRATYHMRLTKNSKPALSSFTKLEFATWLADKKI